MQTVLIAVSSELFSFCTLSNIDQSDATHCVMKPKAKRDLRTDLSVEISCVLLLSRIRISNRLLVAVAGVQSDLSVLYRVGGRPSELAVPDLTLWGGLLEFRKVHVGVVDGIFLSGSFLVQGGFVCVLGVHV